MEMQAQCPIEITSLIVELALDARRPMESREERAERQRMLVKLIQVSRLFYDEWIKRLWEDVFVGSKESLRRVELVAKKETNALMGPNVMQYTKVVAFRVAGEREGGEFNVILSRMTALEKVIMGNNAVEGFEYRLDKEISDAIRFHGGMVQEIQFVSGYEAPSIDDLDAICGACPLLKTLKVCNMWFTYEDLSNGGIPNVPDVVVVGQVDEEAQGLQDKDALCLYLERLGRKRRANPPRVAMQTTLPWSDDIRQTLQGRITEATMGVGWLGRRRGGAEVWEGFTMLTDVAIIVGAEPLYLPDGLPAVTRVLVQQEVRTPGVERMLSTAEYEERVADGLRSVMDALHCVQWPRLQSVELRVRGHDMEYWKARYEGTMMGRGVQYELSPWQWSLESWYQCK